MPVPNTFATATAPIPLSQLDTNFATPITLGNTAIQLGNTVTTLNNMTLANVTISSGNVTITNVSVTTANVTTANIGTSIITTSETLNYGTANGVAYLNTSKVLTTGTALVFDGTNLGVGTSSPAQTLHVKTSTAAGPITLGVLSNSTTLPALSFNGAYASSTMAGIYSNGVAASNLYYTVPANQSHFFAVADSTKMTLDSSGNLGLGVTPSAWSGVGAALQVGTSAAIIGNSANSSSFISNAYFDGTNYRYIGTGFATRFATTSGVYSWNQAASGTAGNTITFTTAMTLDASGNLLLNTTTNANSAMMKIATATRTAKIFDLTATGGESWIIDSTNTTGSTDVLGIYALGASGLYLQDTGNVGIGTSTPATISSRTVLSINNASNGGALNLLVNGTETLRLLTDNSSLGYVYNVANQPLVFGTNNTERARIDASGFTQFSSNLVMPYQGAPTSKAAAATLSGAELITGILSYTGAAATVNLPTGANIEGALTWSANNVSLDFFVINTGSGTCTIGANGNTTLGALTVAAATSAQFRIRRTAANTFTVYRLG